MVSKSETLCFYDIYCNKALELRDKPNDLWKYRESDNEVQGYEYTLYFHNKSNELHYLSSKKPVPLDLLQVPKNREL